MKVRRLGQTFFAEVTGVDLARPLDDRTFAEIRKAHLEHGVVVFRDQELTPGQHIAFSARFGPLQVHPMMQFNLEGAPEILMVSSDRHPDGRPKGIADAGRYWHTDMSYMAEPALGSLLYARAIPDEGGDTMFCDMTAACRDLPAEKREKLLNAKAVHHFASRWARKSTISSAWFCARASLWPPPAPGWVWPARLLFLISWPACFTVSRPTTSPPSPA